METTPAPKLNLAGPQIKQAWKKIECHLWRQIENGWTGRPLSITANSL